MAATRKVAWKAHIVGVDPQNFAPSLLLIPNLPPAPFAQAMLRILLLFALLLWATFWKLDTIASAKATPSALPHTVGTVISPGTILMTLVPKDEKLRAEVWISNQDVGFIHQGQPTKIKFAAYQFQKYGMVQGEVAHLSADATDTSQQSAGQAAPPSAKSPNGQLYAYRALGDLKAQELIADGIKHALRPGMQVTAEIHLGTRTILEYLLSPVMGAFQEAGRER